MQAGKITAKLRDAVPVCLMVNGEEVMRYKNIELPDELKTVEMLDFHFNVPMDGKITFEIHFEDGVLPEEFPAPRTRVSRAAKAAAPVIPQAEETEQTPEPEEAPGEAAEEELQEALAIMEASFHVTGIHRKQLVAAVGAFIDAEPEYKAAPSFAYEIGAYTIDKEGTLAGPESPELLAALQEQGFSPAE